MSENLNPDFPVVTGAFPLTKSWHVHLPEQFNRRVDDGSLVLWGPDLTFWVTVWNNDLKLSVNDQLQELVDSASPERGDERTQRTDTFARLTYELAEDVSGQSQSTHTISGYVISASGYVA